MFIFSVDQGKNLIVLVHLSSTNRFEVWFLSSTVHFMCRTNSDAELRKYHLNAYEFIWFAKNVNRAEWDYSALQEDQKNITSKTKSNVSQQKINQNPRPWPKVTTLYSDLCTWKSCKSQVIEKCRIICIMTIAQRKLGNCCTCLAKLHCYSVPLWYCFSDYTATRCYEKCVFSIRYHSL